MRTSSRLAPLTLTALAFLLGACGPKPPEQVKKEEPAQKGSYTPLTGTAKIKSHDDLPRNDTYCRYKITAVPATGAQMKVGEIVCIYCPPGKSGCDNYSKVEEPNGTTYEVSAMDSMQACTACPKGTDTPPGWGRELR
jgi:hypothetical protein